MLIFANKEKQEIEKEISDQIADSEIQFEPVKSKINKNFGFKQIPSFKDYQKMSWSHFNIPSIKMHEIQKVNLFPYDKLEHILTIEEYKILQEWGEIHKEVARFFSNFSKLIKYFDKLLFQYNKIIRGFDYTSRTQGENNFRFLHPNKENISDITKNILKNHNLIENLILSFKDKLLKAFESSKMVSDIIKNNDVIKVKFNNLFDDSEVYVSFSQIDSMLNNSIIKSNEIIKQINIDIKNIFRLKNEYLLDLENIPVNYGDNDIFIRKRINPKIRQLFDNNKHLSSKELNFVIKYFSDSDKDLSHLNNILIDREAVIVFAKGIAGKTFDNLETVNEFFYTDIKQLYSKYGKNFFPALITHDPFIRNKYFETKNNPKDNEFLSVLKDIKNPSLAKQIYKWYLTEDPQAILLLNDINQLSLSINFILKFIPNFDLNILKNNITVFKELMKKINILYIKEEFIIFWEYFQNTDVRAQNLNQVKNILLKIEVLVRALHNTRYYPNFRELTNIYPGLLKSLITSQWDPTQDVINKFLNLVLNKDINQIFTDPNYQKIALNININFNNLRQDIEKLYTFFSNGVQIPLSYKEKVYQIDNDVNNLLNFNQIEQYMEYVRPKDIKLFNLNYKIKDYNFYVLPDYSPEHFQVGAQTNCCQRIGGAGEDAAIDSFINPLAGVLVLKKGGDLIAQSYFHYVPEDNGYILDNVESNEGNVVKHKTDLNVLYALLANKIKEDFDIKYFKCGKEYNKLNNNYFNTDKMNDDPRHFESDEKYSDFDEDDHLDLLQPNFYIPEIKMNNNSSEFVKEKRNTHKFYQKLLEIKQKTKQS